MATGNNGSFTLTGSGTGSFSVKIEWSETYDVASNTHVVSIDSCQIKSTNWYGFVYYPKGGIFVDGVKVIDFDSTMGTHYCNVQSQNNWYPVEAGSGEDPAPWASGTITGNTDGTKSVEISVQFTCYTGAGTGGSGWSVNGAQNVTLHTIPRKSSIAMAATTMGTAGTIQITRASSAFTHTITYSFGSATGTIATKTTATSVSWTPPTSLAAQVPQSTSGTCTLTCKTYSGNTLIGTSTTTVTLSVPASIKPTFTSITATRVDGTVPSSWGIYVQTKSKATLTINGAAGASGSTITAYSITGGGLSSTQASFTTGFLNTAGSITFTGKVCDSRGRWSDEKTVTINVVAYSTPQFNGYATQRCTSAGTISANGTYGKGNATFSYSSCSNKNSITTAVAYKKSSDSSYTNAGVSFSSGTDFTFGGGNLSADYSYDIRYTLTDAFTTITVVDSLSTASVLMDFKAGGTGLAIGKVSETDDTFEVSDRWDVKVYGMLLAAYINQNGGRLYFATSATAAATAAKTASCTGFHRETGIAVLVKFTYANTVASPTLDVEGTGAAAIVSIGTTAVPSYCWKAGQSVLFVFDGTSWVAVTLSTATTSYYGITKLSSSTSSTSNALAATASAVKAAYDRNSWDSITLTNALAIAYGGTGGTTAAAARTNLGITATRLFNGTLTTGSTTFNYGNYKFYVIIGQPSSTGSRISITVPKGEITTSAVHYQIADESYYYSFNLSYSGTTVTLAYKGRSGTGQILCVYGVN